MIRKLSNLILGKHIPIKYEDSGKPVVTVQVRGTSFPNTLVDLGVTINIMTLKFFAFLGLHEMRPTPTMLELANRFVIKAKGILEDIIVSMESWEYPTGFLVLNLKGKLEGHPLILGRPWLATANSYIGC